MRAPSINTCKNLNRHNSVTLDRNVREKQTKMFSLLKQQNTSLLRKQEYAIHLIII